MERALPFRVEGEGLRLAVRVTPRSNVSRIEGVVVAGDGVALQVRLASPPVDGAANKALLALLADALDLRKANVALRSGETSRLKMVALRGDPDELAGRLHRLMADVGNQS